MNLLLVVSVALIGTAVSAVVRRRAHDSRRTEKRRPVNGTGRVPMPRAPPSAPVEVGYFPQRLDHFSPDDGRQFMQKYFVNRQFYSGTGPVFLHTGGKERLDEEVMQIDGEQWVVMAQLFRAVCYALEPRFYGDSLPPCLGDSSTPNLYYFTIEQTLADLGSFICATNQWYRPQNKKWIVFGCSYDGSLAAWLRLKYPEIVTGAVVSSPVLEAVADYRGFIRVVTQVLHEHSQRCVENIRAASSEIVRRILARQNLRDLEQTLNLCAPCLYDNPLDLNATMDQIFTQFSEIVVDAGNSDGHDEISVQTICDMINDESSGQTALQRYGSALRHILQVKQQRCVLCRYDHIVHSVQNYHKADVQFRLWTFRTCTQLGLFATSDADERQPFSDTFRLEYFMKICQDGFGPWLTHDAILQGIQQTNSRYLGKHLNASRIIIINGSKDPWFDRSISTNSTDGLTVINVEGTSHCSDTYPTRHEDPPSLIAARQSVIPLVASWLR